MNKEMKEQVSKWLEEHSIDSIRTSQHTGLSKNIMEESISRIQSYLKDIAMAETMNWDDLDKKVTKNIQEEMAFTDGIFNNDTLKISDWKELQSTATDPEVVEVAEDMSDLEQEVSEIRQYTTDNYIKANDSLRQADILNSTLSQEHKSSLIQAIEQLYHDKNINVENAVQLDEIQSAEKSKMSATQEDIKSLIDALRADIASQQELLNKLENDFLVKTGETYKACKDKSSPFLLQVGSNIINYGKDACIKAGELLGEAHYASNEIYQNVATNVENTFSTFKDNSKNTINTVKDKFEGMKIQIHANILGVKGYLLESFANQAAKLEDKQKTRIKKYQSIDKVISDAQERINKEFHSLTAITPYQKKEYQVSDEIKQKMGMLKAIQNTNGVRDIGAYTKSLEEVLEAYKTVDATNKKETKIAKKTDFVNSLKTKIEPTVLNGLQTILNKVDLGNMNRILQANKKLQGLMDRTSNIQDKVNDVTAEAIHVMRKDEINPEVEGSESEKESDELDLD